MTAETEKILIVDDDHDFVEALSAFLEAHHYVVLKAHDGREGLKLAKMEHPDLIMMDVIMKERTEGFFTVQEIRRTPELRTVPIFVLTSLYSQAKDFGIPPDSSWLAHDEFLTKPVNMPELLEKVQRCMEERHRNRETPVAGKAEM
jgi:DNA-binding response OmpR family regulator